jgi:hypothetical protein
MTRCPSFELLQEWLADRLGGIEAEAVEAHLEACPACQQSLERLTGGASARQPQGPVSRVDFGGAFLRRLEQEPPAGTSSSHGQHKRALNAKEPGPIPKQALPGEPTTLDGGVAPGRPAGRLQVAPRLGQVQAPSSSGEVQALLRKRLWFLALVLSLLGAINLPVLLLLGVGIGLIFWFNSVVPAVAIISAWVLWSARPLSLRQLRVIEVMVFGTLVAFGVWVHYHFFVRAWSFWKHDPPLFANLYPMLMAMAESGPWAFLIVVYGIFIPNTWRRCAAVVGIMALIPLGLSAADSLAGEPALGVLPVDRPTAFRAADGSTDLGRPSGRAGSRPGLPQARHSGGPANSRAALPGEGAGPAFPGCGAFGTGSRCMRLREPVDAGGGGRLVARGEP